MKDSQKEYQCFAYLPILKEKVVFRLGLEKIL